MPGMGECVLKFPATLAAYERAFGELRCALEAHGVRARGRYNAELVFEEIVTNIIRHGGSDEVHCAVEVCVGFDEEAVTISFYDNGPPFDPRKQALPDLSRSIDEARIGGLGLMLVRKASARIDYERTPQDMNHLTVTIPAGQ